MYMLCINIMKCLTTCTVYDVQRFVLRSVNDIVSSPCIKIKRSFSTTGQRRTRVCLLTSFFRTINFNIGHVSAETTSIRRMMPSEANSHIRYRYNTVIHHRYLI